MFGRLIAMIVGAAAAVAASQGPGFTLQYMQNLAGRVDELRPIVEEFESRIADYGYTRQAAMAECKTASGLLDALCGTYVSVVERFEMLLAHQTELNAANDYMRPVVLAKTFKKDIAESVYKVYKPAVPATPVGFAYGAGGFLAGWGVLSIFFGILGGLFGRR